MCLDEPRIQSKSKSNFFFTSEVNTHATLLHRAYQANLCWRTLYFLGFSIFADINLMVLSFDCSYVTKGARPCGFRIADEARARY